jgi:hypothetical protein
MGFLTQGSVIHLKIVHGLPVGTKFVRIVEDGVYGISIVIEHNSFKELEDGELIPFHEEVYLEKLYL